MSLPRATLAVCSTDASCEAVNLMFAGGRCWPAARQTPLAGRPPDDEPLSHRGHTLTLQCAGALLRASSLRRSSHGPARYLRRGSFVIRPHGSVIVRACLGFSTLHRYVWHTPCRSPRMPVSGSGSSRARRRAASSPAAAKRPKIDGSSPFRAESQYRARLARP